MGACQECVLSYLISHLFSRKNTIPFAYATLAKIIYFVSIFVHLNAYLQRKLKLVPFLLPEKYNEASSVLLTSFYVYVLFLQGFLNADDFLSVALVSMQKQADRMDDVRAAFR